MINRIVLIGRLVRDAELRKTQSGTSVASFSLAVDNPTKKEEEKTTSFIPCVAWETLADNIAKFTHKGSQIAIEGRLQQRTYTNKEGKNVSVFEVIATNMQLLDKKSDSANTETNVATAPQTATQNPTTTVAPVVANNTVEISDDDLPF